MKVMQHSNLQNSSNLLNDFLVKWKHDYASSNASHQACNNFRQVISWSPSTVTIKRKGRPLCYIMEMKVLQYSVFVFRESRFSSCVFHPDANDSNWHKLRSCAMGGFSNSGDEFILIHRHFLSKSFNPFMWPWNTVKLTDLPRNWNYNLIQFCPMVQSSELTRQVTHWNKKQFASKITDLL